MSDMIEVLANAVNGVRAFLLRILYLLTHALMDFLKRIVVLVGKLSRSCFFLGFIYFLVIPAGVAIAQIVWALSNSAKVAQWAWLLSVLTGWTILTIAGLSQFKRESEEGL